MLLADGSEIVVNNNIELANTIREAKDACDEDDDNDYGDDDFTKERLDNLLMRCPWVVYEFDINQDNLIEQYREYIMVLKPENVVKVYARGGDVLTGTWTTRVTDHGALIKLEFDTLVDFTLEWFVYDLGPEKIKLYQEGGNRNILKKNCDIIVDIAKERIENYLQECYWRVARLTIYFKVSGKVLVADPNNGESSGSWLAYRNDGLNLDLYFGTNELCNQLSHRWKIVEITPNRIELKDLSSTGAIERILVLEKKN